MELPIYNNFQYFKDNYVKDFEFLNNIDFRKYLEFLNYQYSEIIQLQNKIKGASINRIDELKGEYKDERILKYVIRENFGFYKNKDKNSIEIKYQNDEVRFLNFQLKREIRYNEISKAHSEILNFVQLEMFKLNVTATNKKPTKKSKLSNPKKLALLQELGIFELPIIKNLSDDKQNEIIGLLLDADKTEFVYKNRLNINSKNPNYQIDKYGSYKYLDEMRNLLKEME